MRIAVISDIHSNSKALDTVLERIKGLKCGRIVCLGDIVGYGYDPLGCIDRCRESNVQCIKGNHEAGILKELPITWFSCTAASNITRQQSLITGDRLEWLRKLPHNMAEGPVGFAHGTWTAPEEFDYIISSTDASLEWDAMKWDAMPKPKCLFVGHTHMATVFKRESGSATVNSDWFNNEDHGKLKETSHVTELKDNTSYIINVGSVGYPRQQRHITFAVYDDEAMTVTHEFLPFDYTDYVMAMNSHAIPLPSWLKEDCRELNIEYEKGNTHE